MSRNVNRYGSWRWNGARQKRPMSSIVLEPGVKDMLIADCRDFLCSEEWYAERGELFCYIFSKKKLEGFFGLTFLFFLQGIPFRRGYLLHGVPGR